MHDLGYHSGWQKTRLQAGFKPDCRHIGPGNKAVVWYIYAYNLINDRRSTPKKSENSSPPSARPGNPNPRRKLPILSRSQCRAPSPKYRHRYNKEQQVGSLSSALSLYLISSFTVLHLLFRNDPLEEQEGHTTNS